MTTRSHRRIVAAAAAFVGLVLLALAPAVTLSQTPASGSGGWCGSDVTPEEVTRFMEQSQGPQPAPLDVQAPYCVPIAAHIVRTSSGTGGMPMEQLTQAILDANGHYAGTGIAFYLLGVDYIDDDFFYSGIQNTSDINALRQTNVVADAVNVYFTPVLPGLCGISSFTFSSVQGIVMNNGCTGLPSNHSTFSHELGHYFDLYHTHETAFGVEYVDGTNCTYAGDRLCDTPADPNLSGLVSPSCNYIGTVTDPHGDPYSPDVSQLMSYARSECQTVFSPQSITKITNTLLTLRSNLLVRGCDPVTPATIAAATPPQGYVDETLDIVLVGANFRPFTAVLVGNGVTASAVDTLSTNDSLLVTVEVDAAAAPGFRDIIVTNAYDPDTLVAGFEVLDSKRHYVSSTGSAHYPYARPQDAATSLADAVAAVTAGDSVLVDSTTVSGVTLIIQTPVTISGGWDPAFTSRDPSVKKTTLDLGNNILISHATGTTTIDGFVLENGAGTSDITPYNGRYGGAVRVVNASVVIADCELRNNDANLTTGFGGGGAIFGSNADVTVTGSHIHDNLATLGGGIYLYQSTGAISNTIIENNGVAAGGSIAAAGAGIAIDRCGAVTLDGVEVALNTGAGDGGGLWVSRSAPVSMTGGEVRGHTVTNYGGGVLAVGSALTLDGVLFSQNQAALIGGAVGATDTASVTVSECRLLDNGAVIGAGIGTTGGEVFVRHNTMARNAAGASGGAMYVAGTGGEVSGNTIHANTAGSGVGGIYIPAAGVVVKNNIVTGSGGAGVNAPSASVSYNLVWNSSGNDYLSTTPGTGAISADPLFADAANDDYHLTLHSPAIDAGDPASAYDDPDGSRADMGRYGSHAFVMDQPSYPKNVATGIAGGQLTISWDRNPEPDVATYAVYSDTTSGFLPSAATLLGTTADTLLTVPAPGDTTYYRVSAVDTDGYAGGYSPEVLSGGNTATGIGGAVALRNRLEQNVPNPFNPTTTIEFALASPARVALVIYDVAGRRVRTLVQGERQASVYSVTWDGFNDRGQRVASGIYFYRLTAGAFTQTRKMVLLK